jgi:hypothetical protein
LQAVDDGDAPGALLRADRRAGPGDVPERGGGADEVGVDDDRAVGVVQVPYGSQAELTSVLGAAATPPAWANGASRPRAPERVLAGLLT